MASVREIVEQAAREGGKAAMASSREMVAEKAGRGNFVTAADLASERVIIDLIRGQFPTHSILAEESAPDVHDALGSEHLWVIDPIDGTNNFGNGRNYSAVSVGYAERGVLKAGAVYDLSRGQLFSAELGSGATLDGKPIKTGALEDLARAVVGADNSSNASGTKRILGLMAKVEPTPWYLMRGSAVLGMCDVAAGRTDLYFHSYLKPWDNAAAFLIAQEAGARVVGLDGGEVNFMTDNVVMGNEALVKQFIKAVR